MTFFCRCMDGIEGDDCYIIILIEKNLPKSFAKLWESYKNEPTMNLNSMSYNRFGNIIRTA